MPGGNLKPYGCGAWGHGLTVTMAALREHPVGLDDLRGLSSLNNSEMAGYGGRDRDLGHGEGLMKVWRSQQDLWKRNGS